MRQGYREAIEEISLGLESAECSLAPGAWMFDSLRTPKECKRNTGSCWRKQELNTTGNIFGDELLHAFRVRRTGIRIKSWGARHKAPRTPGFHEKANVKRQTWLPLHFFIFFPVAGAVEAVGNPQGFPSSGGKAAVGFSTAAAASTALPLVFASRHGLCSVSLPRPEG